MFLMSTYPFESAPIFPVPDTNGVRGVRERDARRPLPGGVTVFLRADPHYTKVVHLTLDEVFRPFAHWSDDERDKWGTPYEDEADEPEPGEVFYPRRVIRR